MISLPSPVQMEDVIKNSFRDYHVRGFDYLCLKRSETETLKLYFFDGDVSKMPEVVNPHDHRYDFVTWVVAGTSQNMKYREAKNPNEGIVFQRFAYETPLLGGHGFTHIGETRLIESERKTYRSGYTYAMTHREIHTIRLLESETVLALVQFEDRVIDRPTLTFCQDSEPPPLSGLYSRFTPDLVRSRLRRLSEIVPDLIVPTVV